ncbi:MAG: peptidylprolyl isomerase, partial [Bdellovibrionota bacterium]
MNSKKQLSLACLIALAVLATGTACKKKGETAAEGEAKGPTRDERTLLTIDGHEVSAEEFLTSVRRLPPVTRSGLLEPEKRQKFLDDFVDEKLLYVEAKKRGLDKDPEVSRRIQEYAERVITQAMRREIQKNPVDDAAIEKYYNDNQAEFTQERSRFSMILKRRPSSGSPDDLKRVEKQIRDIHKKLKGGADFGQTAEKESEDPRSAREKGDLGFTGLERWSPQVKEMGDKLKVGEMSEPFEAGYGWIVLKRTSAPQTVTAPLNEVRAKIAQKLRMQAIDDFKADLKKNAKVDVEDKVLSSLDIAGTGGATPPPAPP